MKFKMPTLRENSQGDVRRVGCEIEFTGVGLETCADIVQSVFGGRIVSKNRFVAQVKDTEFGDCQIEFDSSLLKNKKYKSLLEKMGMDISGSEFELQLEETLASMATILVPYEIVTPPIPLARMDDLEVLREKLQEHHPKGTDEAFRFAFGLHFNPEAPSLETDSVARYIKAFLLLYDWLFHNSEVDLSRRLTSFIDEFPMEYVRLVVDPEYNPDMNTLIRDFLKHNPTRNRPLDLLPLFCEVNQELVLEYDVEKHLIKSRPAYHYRLPNSRVGDPQWTVAQEWNNWWHVEELAADTERLHRMGEELLGLEEPMIGNIREKWAARTGKWLDE